MSSGPCTSRTVSYTVRPGLACGCLPQVTPTTRIFTKLPRILTGSQCWGPLLYCLSFQQGSSSVCLPPFLTKVLKHSEKLKAEYNAHLCMFHLNPTIVNILPYSCVCDILTEKEEYFCFVFHFEARTQSRFVCCIGRLFLGLEQASTLPYPQQHLTFCILSQLSDFDICEVLFSKSKYNMQ